MRRLSVFVVALLVCSAVGAGLPASGLASPGAPDRSQSTLAPDASQTDAGPPGPPAAEPAVTVIGNETTRVLVLPDDQIERNGTTDAVPDASTALNFRERRLDAALGTATLNQSVAEAESMLDREQIVRTELSRVETQTSALRQQERTLFQRHNNESITSRQLVVGLAAIHARAAHLIDRLDALERAAADIDQFSISADASAARADLAAIRGPVRGQVHRTLRADTDVTTVYVETTDRGVVMSMIDDDTFVRSAYRPSVRDPGAQDGGLVIDDVRPLMQELYPREAEVGRIEATHPGTGETLRGTIVRTNESDDDPVFRVTAYFDRGSKKMYKEEVVRQLRTVRNPDQISSTREGLRLLVNRTYPGGPMLLTLRDTQTEELVDGDVTINGFNVGRTGDDGRLWVLSRRGTFTVTATYDPEGPRQPTTFVRVTSVTSNETNSTPLGRPGGDVVRPPRAGPPGV
jgi:hypothetical protein